MIIIGLSGGIATGKSTVATVLQEQGTPLIDCDKIAKEVVQKGHWGYKRVVKAFGQDILRADGELDRAKLGELIFNDKGLRQKLNQATHLPVYISLLKQIFLLWLQFCPAVVVDMPLLFETGSYKKCSTSFLVACEREIQVQRLMKRDGSSRQQAESRVNSQMPIEEKRALAAHVIDNNGSQEHAAAQAREALQQASKLGMLHQIFLGPATVVLVACSLVAGMKQFFTGHISD